MYKYDVYYTNVFELLVIVYGYLVAINMFIIIDCIFKMQYGERKQYVVKQLT